MTIYIYLIFHKWEKLFHTATYKPPFCDPQESAAPLELDILEKQLVLGCEKPRYNLDISLLFIKELLPQSLYNLKIMWSEIDIIS